MSLLYSWNSFKLSNYFWILLFSNLIAPYELVAVSKECTGSESFLGNLAKVKECAERCKNSASMFTFSRNSNGCYTSGCACYCQTAASANGTCNQKYSTSYKLYRYIQEGYISFIIKCSSYQLSLADSVFAF